MSIRPLSLTLNCIQRDIGELFKFGKSIIEKTVSNTPILGLATKVHNFVKRCPNAFFTGFMTLNAVWAPTSFVSGTLIGASCATANRLGFTSLDVRIVESSADKVDFAYYAPIVTLALATGISSFAHGFILGNYLLKPSTPEDCCRCHKVIIVEEAE